MGVDRVDRAIVNDAWSDLRRFRDPPEFDVDLLYAYRNSRIQQEIRRAGIGLLILTNPLSLRYAFDYHGYALFQAHIPETYAYYPLDGPIVLHGVLGPTPSTVDVVRANIPLTFFDAGHEQAEASRLLADDILRFLDRIGCSNRRVGLECLNPSLTQELERRGVEVVDGIPIAEAARVIKSHDEIACMRWSIAIAEHGIGKIREVLRPGVTEVQLWGLLNYTNVANQGSWHEGRMLASGPRTNPWLQEASPRRVECGDLVAFDTDMMGPMGYFADISRTLHCGPAKPSRRQRELYRLAYDEVHHNLRLVRPGIGLREIQECAFDVPEEFREQAYPCVMHAVGMSDEYPRINYGFRGPNFYDGTLEAGMVMCVESYMGAVGEPDGVKLEQQLLVTDDGYELLTSFPFEDDLLQ